MLHVRQGMLMGYFIAFGTTLPVFFQTDNVSLSEGKSTFSVAEMVDLNNPTAGERATASGLASLPAGHPQGSWLFSSLPPSFPNQTK